MSLHHPPPNSSSASLVTPWRPLGPPPLLPPLQGHPQGSGPVTVPLTLSTCHTPACRATAGIGAWDLGRFLFCHKGQVPQSGTVSRGLTHEARRLSLLVVLLRTTVTLSLLPVKAGSKGRVVTEMGQPANGVSGVET